MTLNDRISRDIAEAMKAREQGRLSALRMAKAALMNASVSTDLVERETAEIGVLERYAPPAASTDDVARAVDAAIAEAGASGPKDMGRVMKAVMSALAGKTVDGKAVNELVRKKLSGGA
jgi:uncharacterized protein YqeY